MRSSPCRFRSPKGKELFSKDQFHDGPFLSMITPYPFQIPVTLLTGTGVPLGREVMSLSSEAPSYPALRSKSSKFPALRHVRRLPVACASLIRLTDPICFVRSSF